MDNFDTIGVVGLGYVGLPLALQFARSGVAVIGFDVDAAKVNALNAGESFIQHIPAGNVQAARAVGPGGRPMFEATTDFRRVREVQAVIICVPTPLTAHREPDISYILKTGAAIAPYLQRGALVVLESTTYPGTTEEDLRQAIEEGRGENAEVEDGGLRMEGGGNTQLSTLNAQHSISNEREEVKIGTFNPQPSTLNLPPSTSNAQHSTSNEREEVKIGTFNPQPSPLSHSHSWKAGVDFYLAFSPEREDPGNPNSKVAEIPKVVGGFTPECLRRATALYSKAIRTIVPVSSCRAAEATKLLENIFRGVNIALVNELKVVYSAMGIDVWEVINAANTKPFGYMPFYPGPGLGGHCIPIDPFYLTWKAREYGKHTRFIELAGEINTSMPEYVINRVAEALNSHEKSVKGSRVLVLGLAYKPDVDDLRESPTFALMNLLEARGALVEYHDPHIPVIRPTREHAHYTGKQSRPWSREEIAGYDAVIISTAHRSVNYQHLADWARCIVDSRNAMASVTTKEGQVWKA